jgi:hypothetical protein
MYLLYIIYYLAPVGRSIPRGHGCQFIPARNLVHPGVEAATVSSCNSSPVPAEGASDFSLKASVRSVRKTSRRPAIFPRSLEFQSYIRLERNDGPEKLAHPICVVQGAWNGARNLVGELVDHSRKPGPVFKLRKYHFEGRLTTVITSHSLADSEVHYPLRQNVQWHWTPHLKSKSPIE